MKQARSVLFAALLGDLSHFVCSELVAGKVASWPRSEVKLIFNSELLLAPWLISFLNLIHFATSSNSMLL